MHKLTTVAPSHEEILTILSAEFVQLVQLLVQITKRKQKDLLMITSSTMWLMNQHTHECVTIIACVLLL